MTYPGIFFNIDFVMLLEHEGNLTITKPIRFVDYKSSFTRPKGNRTIADLRYWEKDIICPSTLIFAPIKG